MDLLDPARLPEMADEDAEPVRGDLLTGDLHYRGTAPMFLLRRGQWRRLIDPQRATGI